MKIFEEDEGINVITQKKVKPQKKKRFTTNKKFL